jgi:hypothetical protein
MLTQRSLHCNIIAPRGERAKASVGVAHLRMIPGSAPRQFAAESARESSLVSSFRGLVGLIARTALLAAVAALVAACSGAVSGTAPVVDPTRITILPSTAVAFSGSPTTFIISGGTGSYIVTSSNQAVIPLAGVVTGTTLTVIPNFVASDTTVTLTVRDTGTTPIATATVTVKALTLSNVVTVTPSSTACGAAVCAGGDAEVKVTLSQNGTPLANREVRFDVVSGDFRIITGSAGGIETLALSASTFTDATGTARIRVRVLDQAASQTALLQATDVSSGATLRTSFTIAPASNTALNAQPAALHFFGVDSNSCSSGVSADVIVFGGRPPYSISNPGTFAVNPLILGHSGDRFTVTSTGQCTSGATIAVVDANGASVTVSASNAVGTAVNVPPFNVAPTTVTLDTCNRVVTVALAGGLGPGSYFAASGSAEVFAGTSGNFGFIRRDVGTPQPQPNPGPVSVAFSDGRSVQTVTVNLAGAAPGGGAGTCP